MFKSKKLTCTTAPRNGKSRAAPPPVVLVALTLLYCLLTPTAHAEDLRVFLTRHYRIHTDLDDDLANDLGQRMDAMYDEYARRLVDFPRPDDSIPFEVYLVQKERKYLDLVGLPLAGTGGSFNPRRHLLAAFLDGQGRDALRRTLQHEAFHQFAAEAIGPKLPIWLNEGLAQVFEEGIWTGDGFGLGEVSPHRIRQLHHDIETDSLIDFEELLNMPPNEWAARWHDPTQAATEYNQAWAMTHFLIYAADSAGQPKYRPRLIEMLLLLRNGMNSDEAFATAFSSNIAGFRNRFLEYADGLQPTPQATLIEHQGVLADMLTQAASRDRYFTTFDDFRTACVLEGWRVHYTRGSLQWDSARESGVYFRASDGEPFAPDDQRFAADSDHPLPDMICRFSARKQLRTRFYEGTGASPGGIEHETVVEAVVGE